MFKYNSLEISTSDGRGMDSSAHASSSSSTGGAPYNELSNLNPRLEQHQPKRQCWKPTMIVSALMHMMAAMAIFGLVKHQIFLTNRLNALENANQQELLRADVDDVLGTPMAILHGKNGKKYKTTTTSAPVSTGPTMAPVSTGLPMAPCTCEDNRQRLDALEAQFECIDYDSQTNDLFVNGCNFIVQNTGNSARANKGNLIVGSNAYFSLSGSGNIIAGVNNSVSANNSIIFGMDNVIDGKAVSVLGGFGNEASEDFSSILGGFRNSVTGQYGSVSGGADNTASAFYSSVLGGYQNEATGEYSSVSGGYINTASGNYSSVSGGGFHYAVGTYSSVSGGAENSATGDYSSVLGGISENALMEYEIIPPKFP